MQKRFVVTGGAGYVGSHLVLALVEQGGEVVVVDNLRQGHRAAVPPGIRLVETDVGDAAAMGDLLAQGPWDAVFHFAARSLVGESMELPFEYLLDNGMSGITLIEACVRHAVPKLILSSTANLYGTPSAIPITEDEAIDPGSPYGESKWIIERALLWAERIHGLRHACLRYFNAAGADPEGRLGEDHEPETHLIPLVIDAALGRRPPLEVFGDDYPTADGTCVRDYVHVSDLARAHLAALSVLDRSSLTCNLGTGDGYSVLQVIAAVERVTGRAVPYRIAPRRAGDPPVLVASSARIQAETGWQPRLAALHDIVRTAYAWREAHPRGYDDRAPGASGGGPAGVTPAGGGRRAA